MVWTGSGTSGGRDSRECLVPGKTGDVPMKDDRPCPVRVLLMESAPGGAPCVAALFAWALREGEASGEYGISHVSSLREGLQLLSERSFDIVLLDFQLPDCEGLEGLRKTRLTGVRVPVVVLTAEENRELATRSLAAGAQDVLEKSRLTAEGLLRAVRHAVERVRAESERLDREREPLTILDHAPTMMCLLDPERRIIRCNHPAAAFAARSVGEMIGLRMGEALGCVNSHTSEGCGGANPPCGGCELRKILDTTFGNGSGASRFEVQLVSEGPSGRMASSLLVSTGGLEFSNERQVLVSLEDITDCRAAEREAVERLQFQQVLMDTIPLPIFHKNTRGEFLGCNRAFTEMTGISKEGILGKRVWDIGPAHLTECYAAMDDRLFSSPGRETLDGRFLYADGTLRDVSVHKATIADAENRVTGLVGVVVDKTGQMRSEEERNRLATAVAHAAESIVITDPDGKIRYVNPAFERLTGFSREEALGRDFLRLGNGEHGDRFYESIRKTLASGEGWKGHLGSHTKTGSPREEEASISVVRGESGAILGYVCIKRDVTKEESLERQLRQAQKLEAVGTLAGGIAHDFNNILGAVMGYTELALFDLPEDQGPRKYLVEIMKGARRARELVKQILAFSRKGEQERLPVMVSPILKEALKLLRASLPSTIEIRDRISPCKRLVLGDPTQIHQILMNLCTNAAHAMRDHGGVLGVTFEELPFDAAGLEPHAALKPGVYLRLTVTDTGTGMDQSTVERIFDPYFTTKPMGEGTGLGLAVVHGIVSACGGAIHIESELNKGSTFQVLLPTMADGTEVDLATETAIVVPRGNEHILMVDDEVALTDIGVQLLKHLGYRTTSRNSSVEALELIERDPEAFDLLLTDQTMPQMTGDELVRRVRAIRPDLPIVLCTGFSEKITQEILDVLGIQSFLLKPIVLDQLGHAVRKALDSRREK